MSLGLKVPAFTGFFYLLGQRTLLVTSCLKQFETRASIQNDLTPGSATTFFMESLCDLIAGLGWRVLCWLCSLPKCLLYGAGWRLCFRCLRAH